MRNFPRGQCHAHRVYVEAGRHGPLRCERGKKGIWPQPPGRALALLCADKLTRLEAACTSPDLNRLLSNFIPCLTRRLFGITFSQSGKSVFKDVLTPRAGTCCQFSCCEDPEFTSQNFPVLSRHGFLIIFFFKSKKWKMTAAV